MLSLFIFTVKKGDKKVEASGLSPGTRVGVSPLPFSSLTPCSACLQPPTSPVFGEWGSSKAMSRVKEQRVRETK